MENENDFNPNPTFTQGEEKLTLTDIMAQKKIVSVTIGCNSKEKRVRMSGFKGLFGYTEAIIEEKEVTINDEQGITLNYKLGKPSANIRFWDEKEFFKFNDEYYRDIDENTLRKSYVMTIVHPYQINFHIKPHSYSI